MSLFLCKEWRPFLLILASQSTSQPPLLSISYLSLSLSLSLSLCSRSHPSGQSLLIFGFSSFLLICLLGPPSLFGCLDSSRKKEERKNNRRKTIWCHVFACASGCFINCQLILPLITKWRPITQQKKKNSFDCLQFKYNVLERW